jgi:hypothetical protein
MTAQPITRVELNRKLRAERTATKLFLVAQLAPLRERVERLEEAARLRALRPNAINAHARRQADEYDDDPEDDE